MTARPVLVTGVGGPAGGSLVRQLLERHVPVVGVDMEDVQIPGAQTKVVPPAVDPGMIPELQRIVDELDAWAVIPTVSEELPSLAASREGFGPQVMIGDAGPVLVADDKLTTSFRLDRRGVPVPRFAVPSRYPTLAAASQDLGSPFIAKPRVSRGGRGVVVVRGADDLDWDALDDATILQRFAPGQEFAPVVFTSEHADREPLAVVLEKTELEGGEVGNATSVRQVEEPEIAALAIAAVRAMGLTGPVDMDIRRLSDGTPVVLEINARFGANSAAAPALLEAALADLRGSVPGTGSPEAAAG